MMPRLHSRIRYPWTMEKSKLAPQGMQFRLASERSEKEREMGPSAVWFAASRAQQVWTLQDHELIDSLAY